MKTVNGMTGEVIERIVKAAKKEMLIILGDDFRGYSLTYEKMSDLFLQRRLKVIIIAGPGIILDPKIKELLGDKIIYLKKSPKVSFFLSDGKNFLFKRSRCKTLYKFGDPVTGVYLRTKFAEAISEDLANYLGSIEYGLFDSHLLSINWHNIFRK